MDAKGILRNTGRMTPIFPASITFIMPKYYGNSLWINKSLDIYEGSKIIGTFIVTEIINPVLDASAENGYALTDVIFIRLMIFIMKSSRS